MFDLFLNNFHSITEDSPAEVDNRPLDIRLVDKNWKTRVTAYDDLKKEVQSSKDSQLFSTYGEFLTKMTADSMAAAIDSALDSVIAFTEAAPPGFMKQYAEKLTANVLDKAFGGRPVTQQKGKALILKLIEVDDPLVCITFLLSKLADKKPKIPPLCLEVIEEAIIAFGAKPFPIKDILAALPAVMNGVNGPAREAAMELMLEMTKWIGVAPFHTLLESIRAVQKAEFEKGVSEREAQGPLILVPSVWLRIERPAPGTDMTALLAKAKGNSDGRDFIEDIDLNKKLRTTDYATLIVEEKWSEQLKALTIVIDILGPTPKIKPGCDVGDVIAACKGFLRQGHVQLQVSALKIITLLCNGMRAEFSGTAKSLCDSIVSKGKEKRLVPEVQATLTAMLKYCIGYDSMAEYVNEQIANKKAPAHARIGLNEFVQQNTIDNPEKFSNDSLKPLCESLAGCAEDPDPKVRETSATALAAIAVIVRQRGKNAGDSMKFLNSLELSAPRLFKKIQAGPGNANNETPSTSAFSAAVSANATSAASISQIAAPVKSEPNMTKPTADGFSQPSSGIPGLPRKIPTLSSRPPGAAPSTASASTSAAVKKSAPASGAPMGAKDNADDDNVEELAMNAADAELALAALGVPNWAGAFQENIMSVKWQEKSEAITLLGQTIAAQEVGGQYSTALIVYLSAKTAGFKISNVNILKAVMEATCAAAKHVGGARFSRPAAWELIRSFGDRYSDKKTKEPVDELLSALCNAVQPAFVLKRMCHVMDKVKAPLAHQHYLEWLKSAIKDIGVGAFPLPSVALFCHLEMENKIATVRSTAVEVMGAMYHQVGPRFLSIAMTDGIKPQMQALLEAEFEKVGYDPSIAAAKASASGVPGASLPRQDIFSLLDKNILVELNISDDKTSWQNRKTALENILAACERSGHYLDPGKNSGELVKSLKARMNDTQANLKPIAAAVIGHLVASFEISIGSKLLRLVAEALLGGLADNKKSMRDATTAAMQIAVTQNKTEEGAVGDPLLVGVLVSPVGEALTSTVVGRQELLMWLLPQVDAMRPEHACAELTAPLVTCMQDKIAAVRTLAEQVLYAMMTKNLISKVALDKAVRDLPPATKRSLQPSIDKLMAVQVGSSASSGATTTGATTTASSVSTAMDATLKKSGPIDVSAPKSAIPSIRSSGIPGPGSSSLPIASSRIPAISTTTVPVSVPLSTVVESIAVVAAESSNGGTSEWKLKRTTKSKRLDDRIIWPQPPEEPGEADLMTLKAAWEPFLSPDFTQALFPPIKSGILNQDSVSGVMNDLCTQLDSPPALWLSHSDFIIRYLSCCLCLRETGPGMIKVLQALLLLFLYMKREAYLLHDAEIAFILPHLIDKAGHKSDRQKTLFKQVLGAVSDLIGSIKLNQHYVQGLNSKNKKSRIVCIEEILHIVEVSGAASLGKVGIKEVGGYLDKETDPVGRTACLDLCCALYLSLGSDLPKLLKLMGEAISEKSASLIEDRIKQKGRNQTLGAPVAATSSVPPTPSVSTSIPVFAPVAASFMPSLARTTSKPPGPVLSLSRSIDVSRTGLVSNDQPKLTTKDPLPGLYGDIATKLDAMLGLTNEAATGGVSAALLADRSEEARDYIKILHALISGEWSNEAPTQEDEEMLHVSVDRMAVLLIHGVSFAFKCKSLLSVDQDHAAVSEPENVLMIDVALVAVLLATLFALVKRKELLVLLEVSTVALIYKITLSSLVDPRLSNAAIVDGNETSVTAKQILKGLNTITLRIAAELPYDQSLCLLIPLLTKCNLAQQGVVESDEDSVLEFATQPLSRLIRRIVYIEVQSNSPFQRPQSNIDRVLIAVHEFLSTAAVDFEHLNNDDVNTITVKTIVGEMSRALGSSKTIGILELANIPLQSSIYRLCHIHLAREEAAAEELRLAQELQQREELQQHLMALIQEITSARDKTLLIARLHALRKEHPELDVNGALQSMSSAFRRFVIDTLSKLAKADTIDENDAPVAATVPTLAAISVPSSRMSMSVPASPISKGASVVSDDWIAGGMGTTRSRIPTSPGYSRSSLDPLRPVSSNIPSSPHRMRTLTPGGGFKSGIQGPSPRVLLSEKVRNSLSTLSSALSLDETAKNGDV